MRKLYYIYELISPIDGKPFYVGMTTNVKKRLKDHLSHLTPNSKEGKLKVEKIKDIKASGVNPYIQIIACVLGNKKDSELMETYHINKYANTDIVLCNQTDFFNRTIDNGKSIKVAAYKNGELVKTFSGVRAAAKEFGLHHSGITGNITGKRQSAGGFNWVKL